MPHERAAHGDEQVAAVFVEVSVSINSTRSVYRMLS